MREELRPGGGNIGRKILVLFKTNFLTILAVNIAVVCVVR